MARFNDLQHLEQIWVAGLRFWVVQTPRSGQVTWGTESFETGQFLACLKTCPCRWIPFFKKHFELNINKADRHNLIVQVKEWGPERLSDSVKITCVD